MALDPSWRPAEDGLSIFNEQTWLAGAMLTAVGYGIVFTLFVLTSTQLIRNATKYNRTQRLFLVIYNTTMLILATLFVGSIAKMTQLSFVDYRMYPGGPAAFENDQFSIPIDMISIVAYVIANWLADGMVIYRYMVIYKSSRRLPFWMVMIIPILAYMASISLSVVWLIQVSSPQSSPWISSSHINFTAPYFWMSLSLNISMTIAICARLFLHRWRIARVLGPKHGTEYTSVAAIIVESSFLYSAFALLFLIPFALQNPIQNIFIQLMGEIQIIAPLLISYRVAYGAAWVNGPSRDFVGTKETKNSGAGVQVDFPSSAHKRPSNHFILDSTSDIPRPAGEFEMGKLSKV